MTNWKLTTLFAVALMLVAGMFSTAIAADGDGTMTVEWSPAGTNLPDAGQPSPTPLPAHSKDNQLRFTYTVEPNTISMAGGELEIDIPDDWKIQKKALDPDSTMFKETTLFDGVVVAVAGISSAIYDTHASDEVPDVDGEAGKVLATTDKDSIADFKISGESGLIQVTFGPDWSNGGVLTITLNNVTTAIPTRLREGLGADAYTYYPFVTRSKASGGVFVRLKPTSAMPNPQPRVRVGNILGARLAGAGATVSDLAERAVKIEPATAYAGEKYNYTVTFTAPGPMHGFTLTLTVPDNGPTGLLAPNGIPNHISVSAPGAAVSHSVSNREVTVNLTRIDKGQTVVVTYRDVTVGDTVAATATTPNTSAFTTVQTTPSGGSAANVTKLEGGKFAVIAGSGTLAVSPGDVRVDATIGRLTLTYTAATAIKNQTLEIAVPKGIMASRSTGSAEVTDADDVPTHFLQLDRSKDGYVSSPDSKGAVPVLARAIINTSGERVGLSAVGNTGGTPASDFDALITWSNVELAKGKTFRTYIDRVKVADAGQVLNFHAAIGETTTVALAETASLYIVDPMNDGVTFTSSADYYLNAAKSIDVMTFTFEAQTTPIKGGRVQFSIPSGWSAPVKSDKDDVVGAVWVTSGGGTGFDAKTSDLTVSGRTITVMVKNVEVNTQTPAPINITYKKATIQDRTGSVKINGYYWASGSSPRRGAGTIIHEIENVDDGVGTATISPNTVRAGSIDQTFAIVYTAMGTMDGGAVSLEIPANWGPFVTDPTLLNYVTVTASGGASIREIDNGGSIIIVSLDKCPPRGRLRFVYGTGTGVKRGAKVQDNTGTAAFMIKARGTTFGVLTPIGGRVAKSTESVTNPKALGKVFTDAKGKLQVEVTGASDGTGTATVAIRKTDSGDGAYTDQIGQAVTEMRVHAADMNTYLTFEYTPTQTIENGELRFTVPAGWTSPQGSSPSDPGFTRVQGTGGATIESADFTAATNSLTVPITLIDTTETIEIHYGEHVVADSGGAMAPATMGDYNFTIDIKGSDAETAALTAIRGTADGDPLTVKVYDQSSGSGSAAITAGADSAAGATGASVTVVYTAAGDMGNGGLKLTIPAGWSAPTTGEMGMGNVAVTSTGTVGAIDAGGNYGMGATLPTGLGAMDVTVDSVSLDAGGTVTFVYSNAMVQPTMGEATFGVMVMSSAGPNGPDDVPVYGAVSAPMGGTLMVNVGEAAAGSGTASVDAMGAVITAGSAGNSLSFTYTANGTISYPREFRVRIPATTNGWSMPNGAAAGATVEGSYTVSHANAMGHALTNIVEKLSPVGMEMVARATAGGMVKAGDTITFTYENADAPLVPEISNFQVLFDGMQVGDDIPVIVQSAAGASMLAVEAPAQLLSDTQGSVPVTIKIQDADGHAAALGSDLSVMLSSSNAAGTFSATDGGAAIAMATIAAGSDMTMVYYSDMTLGDATITASATGLASGMAAISITTEVTTITSVTVNPTLVAAGDTVTINALGSPGRTAMFSVGAIVTNGTMSETAIGSYSGSFDVVADHHADGSYTVTVTLGNQSAAGALTIDSTAPVVTASASPAVVANGDTVTVSATVVEAGMLSTITADVSALDSTQTSIPLSMGTDGTYSGSFVVSEMNEALNGDQTITVNATDAAGNSGMGSATVALLNEISFTSTLPAGISLFSVPLDEEGLDTVGDLETKLGDNVNLLITYDGATWNSRSSDVMITGDLGILVSMAAETTVTFTGHSWGDSTISLSAGSNLVGLPVNDANVANISDIAGLFGAGVVSNVIASSGGSFQLVVAAGDAADGPIAGDAAYLVMASTAGSAMVSGDGWENGNANAAPIALVGYTVDNQTPVLDVHGSVVDEITGLAKEGFRVKVKNLSTKAALSNVTAVEVADGYNMTFVDLDDNYAARVGDVLEISADSPNPLIGVQPVRHVVTVDDVKANRIQLEDLIAYEIPAETELLRNYPNPFNPETWIPYHLAQDANVSLTIYDVNGELVRSIDVGHQSAAKYDTRAKAIYWDGRNQFGEQVASGIYFYSLSAGDFSATRKMVILK